MIDIPRKLNIVFGQPKNWKVTAVRASIDKLIYQMVYPYLSIYIIALGATGTRLGLINGLGMAVSALYGLLGAFFIRGFGTKKIYLTGLSIVALSYLVLGLSGGWVMAMAGMVAWWLGSTEASLCCNVVCGGSLGNATRATAMGSCESVAQGTMSFIGPAIGAGVIGLLGGMSVASIRPLFYMAFIGELGCIVFVRRALTECAPPDPRRNAPILRENPFRILKKHRGLGKFIAVSCLASMPTGMVLPFTLLFAQETKGASPYILGAMVTASAVVSLVAGLPIGRIADRIGRKKVLFALAPLFWASNILLVSTSNPVLLIASGVLQGVFPVVLVISAAMTFEQVPRGDIGDWMAVVRFFRMLMGAVLTLVSGLVWDHLGGQWVFLLVTGIDLLVRMPLLAGMPETLGNEERRRTEEHRPA